MCHGLWFNVQEFDSETREVIDGMFSQLLVAKVKVAKSQKQKGKKDCGLFAIAYATALAYGHDLSKVKFCQEFMWSHLVSSALKIYF